MRRPRARFASICVVRSRFPRFTIQSTHNILKCKNVYELLENWGGGLRKASVCVQTMKERVSRTVPLLVASAVGGAAG